MEEGNFDCRGCLSTWLPLTALYINNIINKIACHYYLYFQVFINVKVRQLNTIIWFSLFSCSSLEIREKNKMQENHKA